MMCHAELANPPGITPGSPSAYPGFLGLPGRPACRAARWFGVEEAQSDPQSREEQSVFYYQEQQSGVFRQDYARAWSATTA